VLRRTDGGPEGELADSGYLENQPVNPGLVVMWISTNFADGDMVQDESSSAQVMLLFLVFVNFLLLSSTLPGPSAFEVTTLWRYTNLFIIIII